MVVTQQVDHTVQEGNFWLFLGGFVSWYVCALERLLGCRIVHQLILRKRLLTGVSSKELSAQSEHARRPVPSRSTLRRLHVRLLEFITSLSLDCQPAYLQVSHPAYFDANLDGSILSSEFWCKFWHVDGMMRAWIPHQITTNIHGICGDDSSTVTFVSIAECSSARDQARMTGWWLLSPSFPPK